jgi:hypothetical protein
LGPYRPFGAAEVREGEVGFLLGHEVGVGSECELGVLVAELICDPSEGRSRDRGRGCPCCESNSKSSNRCMVALVSSD